jgi:hypothetical protein
LSASGLLPRILVAPLHSLYTLRIGASFPLRGWPTAQGPDAPPDIEFELAHADIPLPGWADVVWTPARNLEGPGWRQTIAIAPPAAHAVLRLEAVTATRQALVVYGREARQVVMRWRDDTVTLASIQDDFAAWSAGTLMAFALAVRGVPVLHAGVVEIAGRASAFIAPSGAGKSTLAAALVAAGQRLVADDHLALRAQGEGFVALPGAPGLRLLANSVATLGLDADDLPFVSQIENKRYLAPAPAEICSTPIPVGAIYLLMPPDPARTAPAIVPMGPAEALHTLLTNRFGAFLPAARSTSATTALARLVQQVPVARLHRPFGLETLPAVVETLTAAVRPAPAMVAHD